MQPITSLEDEQRRMRERRARIAKHKSSPRFYQFKQVTAEPKPKPKPKSNKWLLDHFTEIMEDVIDDLGLDVPRRERKDGPQ